MADFTIHDVEGMRQVQIVFRDETVRARKGAMSNFKGKIRFTPRLPGAQDLLHSVFNRETSIRPYYEGTGTVMLQASLGGYHLLDVVKGEQWILEPGVFCACEGDIQLGMKKDVFWQSFWAGDGLFPWKTTLTGAGRVVINAPGSVETIDINDEELRVQGRHVLGRTKSVTFSSERPSTFLRCYISGQDRLRVYKGTGKALVCWSSYWNETLLKSVGKSEDGNQTIFV